MSLQINRYVKVKGYDNWFLLLESNQAEPDGLSENMQKSMFRSQFCKLHGDTEVARQDFKRRIIMIGINDIDYENIAKRSGAILIRPTGSYMPLAHNEITEETFDTHFPIDDFGEIVICENDEKAEYKWVRYLNTRFPDKKIVTINFFDLRTEEEVNKFFDKAKYITFSTTFSKYEWFKKLNRHLNSSHKVIGYCHIEENWKKALQINPEVEIITAI